MTGDSPFTGIFGDFSLQRLGRCAPADASSAKERAPSKGMLTKRKEGDGDKGKTTHYFISIPKLVLFVK